MTSELDRLEAAFHRLAELSPEARRAALDELAETEGTDFSRALAELLAADTLDDTPLDTPISSVHAAVGGTSVGDEPAVAPQPEPLLDHLATSLPSVPGYRPLRAIGRGGSATVFLAEEQRPEFTRPVALKIIDRFADPATQRRVASERQILARLEHAGIARLYDAGTTPSGQPFLAMEWVDGESIVDHCRAHDLSIAARLRLFLAVLEAVDHAHRFGVVHRDLKPANILVAAGGEPKLLDFGIAKWYAPAGEPEETRTLLQAMTPAYASPEQIRGERVTVASDIYSLGVVLYELLVDRLPYRLEDRRYESYAEAIRSQQPEPPSTAFESAATASRGPSTSDSTVPARRLELARRRKALRGDLDAVVLKTLRKEPSARYAAVADLAADLRRVLAGEPVSARASERRYRLWRAARRVARPLAATALAGLVLAALAILAVPAWRAGWLGSELAVHPIDELATHSTWPTGSRDGRAALRRGADELRAGQIRAARASFTSAARQLAGTAGEALATDGLARALGAAGEVGLARASAARAAQLAQTPAAAEQLPPEELERIGVRGLAAARDWAHAVPALDRLFGRLPERADIGLDLVAALADSGQTTAADAVLTRIQQLPAQARESLRDPRVDLAEAEVSLRYGELQRAAAAAQRARLRTEGEGLESLAARARRLHAEAVARLDLGDEAVPELESAVLAGEAAGLVREPARSRLALARILSKRPENTRTDEILARALEGLKQAEDDPGKVEALVIAAFQDTKRGDIAAGLGRCGEAERLARSIGDGWVGSEALVCRLVLYNWANDNEGVLATREPTLQALRDSGNRQRLLQTLGNLALDAIDRRELDTAESYLEEATRLARLVGSRLPDADLDRAYGFLAESRGAYGPARERYEAALAKARLAASPVSVASLLSDLGTLEMLADRPAAAEVRAHEAIAALGAVGKASSIAEMNGVLAWVAARRGDRVGAERLLGSMRAAVADPDGDSALSVLDVEARIAEAFGDWDRALSLRRRTVRITEEHGVEGLRAVQLYGLARALHATGRRRELERLAGGFVAEADRRGDHGLAAGLRALLADTRGRKPPAGEAGGEGPRR